MQTIELSQIPSADAAPTDDYEPSPVGQSLAKLGLTRRSFLRAAVGTGMAIGITTLGWLPPLRGRTAQAGHYTEWSTCQGYYDSVTICVPTWSKFTNNCDANKWHRNDSSSGTCYVYNYTHYGDTCNNKNAWKWGSTRCSDGWYYYEDCGGGYTSTFSICRSTV